MSDPAQAFGGPRDGATLNLPPYLAQPGERVRLPVVRPVETVPESNPLAPYSEIEVAEYAVEMWREPADASPRYRMLRHVGTRPINPYRKEQK